MSNEVQAIAVLLRDAIKRKVMVEAEFNRSRSVLAPHSLIEKNGELYLKAVTVARPGLKRRDPRLGTFKLHGLRDVTVTRRLFSAANLFSGF